MGANLPVITWLSLVGVAIVTLTLYAVTGYTVGTVGRYLRRRGVVTWATTRKVLKFLGFGVLAILTAGLLLVLVMMFGITGLMAPRAAIDDGDIAERRLIAEMTHDGAAWHIQETISFELTPEAGEMLIAAPLPHPWSGRRPQRDSGEYMLLAKRIQRISQPLRISHSEYIQPLSPPEVHILKVLEMSRQIRSDRLIDVTLLVPQRAVIATDPPADPTKLARGRSKYSIEVPTRAQLEIELAHSWLRNEAGDLLFQWNLWAILKWAMLTFVALFSDRIREHMLSPVVDRLFKRRRNRRRSAGFVADR